MFDRTYLLQRFLSEAALMEGGGIGEDAIVGVLLYDSVVVGVGRLV